MTTESSPLLYPPIPQGICVAVVAPGGYARDDAVVQRGIERLTQLGCEVRLYLSQSGPYQRFSATDEERIALLHQAAQDPDVHIVMALRGGYGTSRLLDNINWDLLAVGKKIWVGYSDITALHLGLLALQHQVSFAGPMVCGDFGSMTPDVFTQQSFWRMITQERYSFAVEAAHNPEVAVEGTVWGGNLAMLTHLCDTPYFPEVSQGIVFVEDVNEHPYRVERMLLQLHYSGVLDNQQALVLGQFSDYRLSEYDNGYDFAAMVAYIRDKLNIPVLTDLPFGHVPHRVTLPVGGRATLVSDQYGYSVTLSDYPHLAI